MQRIWYRPIHALCMLPQYLRVHTCVGHVNLADLLLVFSIPSGSCILSASSAVGFSEPWGSNVMATSTLELNVPEPLTLHNVWLWVSLFGPLCFWRKLL